MQLMHKRIQKRIVERKQEKTCRETFRLMAEACHSIALLDMETGISRLVRSDTGEKELSGLAGGKGGGIQYDSWLGRTSRELVHPDFREEFTTQLSTESLREKFCQGHRRQSLIYRSRRSVGGEYRWLQAEYIVPGGSGEVIYYISDISDRLADMENSRKELEEGLKRARRENSIKMEFMEHLCQEVRIPAGAVTGMNRLAARSMERGDQEGARYYHAAVDRLAEYMKRLMTDVVDTAAVERTGMTLSGGTFSFREVQEECHAYSRSLVRDRELSLAWSGEMTGSYWGDGERIKLAFFGIMENAVRYNRTGCQGDIRKTAGDGEQRSFYDPGDGQRMGNDGGAEEKIVYALRPQQAGWHWDRTQRGEICDGCHGREHRGGKRIWSRYCRHYEIFSGQSQGGDGITVLTEWTASVGFVVLALAEILCYNPNMYVCVHIFTVRGQTSTKAREGMN